jgi:integrase/recombinase XerC
LIDFFASRYRRDELPDVPTESEVTHLIEGELPHFLFQKTGYRREERDRLIVELLASGMLPSDLVNLDLEDCRGDSMLVRASKSHAERIVTLSKNAKMALGAWLPIRTALLEKFKLATPATRALLLTASLNRPAKRLNRGSVQRIAKDAKARAPLAEAPLGGEPCSTYSRRERANMERDRLILELLYGCGIRVSELVGINLDDFWGSDILLVRGKGKKERLVIVGECARAALNAWLQVRQKLLGKTRLKTPALFFSVGPRRSAERLAARSVGRIIKIAAETCGLDSKKWHPHLLRHAAATHMCDHGASLQSVSTLLGHAKLSTTEIYTRVSTGRLRRSYDAAHPHAKG